MSINMKKYNEVYISVSVEINGSTPGVHSIVSIGAFLAGGRVGDSFEKFSDKDKNNTFYKELKPITDDYVVSAIREVHLERLPKNFNDPDGKFLFEFTESYGQNPEKVMKEFNAWVESIQKKYSCEIVFMAYPANVDWMFIYDYLKHYKIKSDVDYSKVVDLKKLYYVSVDKKNNWAKKKDENFFLGLPYTHFAIDDAVIRGELAMSLLEVKQ